MLEPSFLPLSLPYMFLVGVKFPLAWGISRGTLVTG